MSPLVVLLALAAVATASPSLLHTPLAQPPHHPAVVLDPHGRPLDTAEVIAARALHLQAKALEHAPIVHSAVLASPVAHAPVYAAPVAHSVYAAPAAISHQSRVDVHSSPAVVAHSVVAPAIYSGHHSLWKRSFLGGLLGYSASPVVEHTAYVGGSAVSHQSRVDVHSSPAVVAHSIAPVVTHVPTVYAAPAAISHQSQVSYHSSPAVVAHAAVAPLAHSVYAPVSYSAHGLGHYLKKRSLGHLVYAAPSAVSHQSRVDYHSSPALVSHAVAPVAYASAPIAHPVAALYAAPAAVSHQSRVDVHSSPALVAHSYVAPLAHAHSYAASPLLHHSW